MRRMKLTLAFHSLLAISCIAAIIELTESFVFLPLLKKKFSSSRFYMGKSDGDSKKGYRFGDLTRGLLKKVKEDSSSSSYKFGDISRWLDKKAKAQVSEFTNKQSYQFGDLSKEIVRRLRNGEYTREDLWLFLKIVATIGINIQPVTSVLPLKVLTELLNMTMEASIAQTVGNKVVSSITNEIDGRMKELVTGDRNYELGDMTKRALSNWTRKENYEVGDITKTVLNNRAIAKDSGGDSGEEISGKDIETLELFSSQSEKELLEEWDKKLLKARQDKSGLGVLKDEESYKDWDEKFMSSTSSSTQ